MQRFLLTHVPALLLGLLFIAVSVGLGVGGLLLVRRRFTAEALARHSEAASVLIGLVGGLYGILLAFVVAIAWQQFDDASAIADSEAGIVLSLYRGAAFFPDDKVMLRADIERYARAVADEEWDAMATSQEDAAVADEALFRLGATLATLDAANERESAIYAEYLSRLKDLEEARQSRLFASGSAIPGQLWIVLLLGGIITVGFSYFFATASRRAHTVMVAGIAASIGLTLFLIASLDLPFTGDVSVEPTGMQAAIGKFAHIDSRF